MWTLASLGSHSCLQILKGAQEEGFKTLAISLKKMTRFYRGFNFIDEVIEIEKWSDFFNIQKDLLKRKVIFIPHGSCVAYLGSEKYKAIKIPHFGNKEVLNWEADRLKQYKWLNQAKILTPRVFASPKDINRLALVKFFGAAGGKSYFFVRSKEEFNKKIKNFKNKKFIIQEYVIGVPIYIHYFYSPLEKKIEIVSIDRRYETNIDSLGRLPLETQADLEIEPSFVVVGNSPLMLRESMLMEAQEMAERTVKVSQKIMGGKGLFGPFCLETIVTPDQKFYVIEISCRIVAGTNLFIPYSPYSYLTHGKPMSTGRRIAKEINSALDQNKLDQILG